MYIDYFNPPEKSEEELHKKYLKKNQVINLEEIMSEKNTYIRFFQELLDILKYGFEKEEIRKFPLKIKFHPEDKKTYTIEIRHLITNLIFWRMFIDTDQVERLGPEYFFDVEHFSPSSMKQYIDEKQLPIHDGDFRSKNAMVDDICHAIISISHAFCLLMGMGISLYDIKEVEKRHPELHELMFGEIDPNLSPNEVEAELSQRTDTAVKIFISDRENNDMKPLLVGKTLKTAQFREFLVKIGFKADINGNTIPILIDGNFLAQGLQKPSHLYINALGGRKSLILTKIKMGEPGAFSKKLSQNTTSASILGTEECCDSIGYIQYYIKDETFLKTLDGRIYYDQYGTMKKLDYRRDKHLIGKVVPFRSPMTCHGHDGICQACYGHLYDLNKDMFSVGCLASLKISSPVGQAVLSSKHSQSTDSAEISFPAEFDSAFEMTSTEITLKEDSDLDADLSIRLGEVFSEELDDAEFLYVHEFDLIDNTNGAIYHIKEDHDAKMYLNDTLLKQYKKLRDKSTPISLESLDDEESLFSVEVHNKELTEPIKIFQKILNTNEHMGAHTMSEFAQVFAEALFGMGTKYDLVNAECILRAQIRKKSNPMEFPDFSMAGNPNDWQIMRLNDALFYNPSALVSMTYGYLRKQFVSTELYEKTAPSHFDTLFVPRLSDYIYDK